MGLAKLEAVVGRREFYDSRGPSIGFLQTSHLCTMAMRELYAAGGVAQMWVACLGGVSARKLDGGPHGFWMREVTGIGGGRGHEFWKPRCCCAALLGGGRGVGRVKRRTRWGGKRDAARRGDLGMRELRLLPLPGRALTHAPQRN